MKPILVRKDQPAVLRECHAGSLHHLPDMSVRIGKISPVAAVFGFLRTAQQAGAKAAAAITDRIDNAPDTGAKKRAVFALSQLPKDEGVPLLVKVARTHRNPDVRKQAIFWLGQSNDPRALSFFEELLAVR